MIKRRDWLKGLVLALGLAWAGASVLPASAQAEER